MEHLHIPLLSLLVFLLDLSSLHFLSLADDYYINCGSQVNASLTKDWIFFGESKSGYSFSKSNSITDINQPDTVSSSPYQTARGFSKPFYYQFSITENGTYLVRLHFSAFSSSSSYNLSTAVFSVLDSKSFILLNNFTAKNSTNSPLIKEFLLQIDNTDSFRLYFTPQPSSFAFVNAIELFLTPSHFIAENYTSSHPLHTIYRLNVGGSLVNDSIWRLWETDDGHLSDPNTAKNANPKTELDLKFLPGEEFKGMFISNYTFAPKQVYQTAKEMSNTSSRPAKSSNITWSFSVSKNASHIVRAHFCDIIGSAPGNIIFNLYSNGNFRKEIGGIDPSVPFYYDFLVNSSESELINISIRPRNGSQEQNAFLNGLEILEIVEGKGSIPHVEVPMKNIVAVVVGSVLGGLFLICILIAGFVYRLRHTKKEKGAEPSVWSPMPANGGGSSHSSAFNLNYLGLKISFAEIQSATNNFDTKLVIGKGGFGNVYKGTLLNGTKVAVKRAYKRSEEGSSSGQGLSEFETEIIILSKIRHRHLVSLIGYCNEGSEMILVYEFMEKGTLRDHLYNSDVPRLSWEKRLEICTGAARGLDYLHTGAAGRIIHRDVKSSNILLDENHVAKVADFGLSRSGALDETHVSTNVKGTFGYLDPEYMISQQLTEKSDVYSFGVVLLEVLCGRPVIDQMLPREQMNLAEWGMFYQKRGKLEQIVDSALKGHIDPSSLRKFGETVEKCLPEDSCDRPTMADVLWDLEYALRLQQTTKLREAHEDSTTIDASSAAFGLPIVQRLPSLGSARNGDDIREDDLTTTESEIFSQLKVGDAR